MILLQETVLHAYPIWTNAFFYLFVITFLYTVVSNVIYLRLMRKRVAETKLLQSQHVAKVDIIRKEHGETLEKLRVEMLKREEERSRQWMESEKETLHVLNGVSTLLDLNEKIGRVESEKILKKLDELTEKVESLKILKALEDLQEKVKKLTIVE